MAVLRQYEEKNREQRASLINEKHEEEQVRILAYTDLLTGCYNRQYANEILRSFWDTEETFTFCFVDLDGLKKVNDVMGHIEGDEYIRLAAKAIGNFIRKEDYLFRYGGDEFLIVSRTLTPDIVGRRMEQVNEALAQESVRRKITLKMAVSYGVAAREESASLDELIRLADPVSYTHLDVYKRQPYMPGNGVCGR